MSKPEIEVKFNEQNPAQPTIPPRVPQITGMVKTVDSEPSGTPRSFFEQFRIFNNVLYWYDTLANAWFNSGGGAAGSDTQIQFNDGGAFGGDAGLLYEKTSGKLFVSEVDTATVNSPGNLNLVANGYIVMGSVSADYYIGGAIPTNANVGFLKIPNCAGIPTGVPAAGPAMIFDYTNNDLYMWNGSWKKVHFA